MAIVVLCLIGLLLPRCFLVATAKMSRLRIYKFSLRSMLTIEAFQRPLQNNQYSFLYLSIASTGLLMSLVEQLMIIFSLDNLYCALKQKRLPLRISLLKLTKQESLNCEVAALATKPSRHDFILLEEPIPSSYQVHSLNTFSMTVLSLSLLTTKVHLLMSRVVCGER